MSDFVSHSEDGGPKGSPNRSRGTAAQMSDERIAGEREQQERMERDRLEDERVDMFIETQYQSVLPRLPDIDGYHTVWLTTNNPRDSIPWRLSVGYELIRVTDFPEWNLVGSQEGNYSGVVAINEMIAAKIPETLYQKLMLVVGHLKPMQEEERVKSISDNIRARARAKGVNVYEGEGTADIVQRVGKTPVFLED